MYADALFKKKKKGYCRTYGGDSHFQVSVREASHCIHVLF